MTDKNEFQEESYKQIRKELVIYSKVAIKKTLKTKDNPDIFIKIILLFLFLIFGTVFVCSFYKSYFTIQK